MLVHHWKGNKYLLVITYYFTKFVDAYGIPNQDASTIADVVIAGFFKIWGLPIFLHTDQGRNFESRLFKEVADLLGIEKIFTGLA